MTKRPTKANTGASRHPSMLRNRIALAAVAVAGAALAIWSPWSAPKARPQHEIAAIAPMPPPSPPAAALTPAAAPTPAFTTASVSPEKPQRMPAALEAAFDVWLIDAYKACWSPPKTTPEGDRYLPRVRVALKADGALAGAPKLVNPPWDPAWKAHAEAALRAVKACDPLRVPDKYAPYYPQWKTKTVFFDPTQS